MKYKRKNIEGRIELIKEILSKNIDGEFIINELEQRMVIHNKSMYQTDINLVVETCQKHNARYYIVTNPKQTIETHIYTKF